MKTVKAIFEIQEGKIITGVMFKCGNKTLHWNDLTRQEQIRMLNAWISHYELFSKFLKEIN